MLTDEADSALGKNGIQAGRLPPTTSVSFRSSGSQNTTTTMTTIARKDPQDSYIPTGLRQPLVTRPHKHRTVPRLTVTCEAIARSAICLSGGQFHGWIGFQAPENRRGTLLNDTAIIAFVSENGRPRRQSRSISRLPSSTDCRQPERVVQKSSFTRTFLSTSSRRSCRQSCFSSSGSCCSTPVATAIANGYSWN